MTYQAWVEKILNKQTKITIFFAFISVMIVDILAFKIGLSCEKPFNLVCSATGRCSGQARAPVRVCAGQVNSAPVKYKRMVYYWTKELCGCCILLFIPNQCKGQISNEKIKAIIIQILKYKKFFLKGYFPNILETGRLCQIFAYFQLFFDCAKFQWDWTILQFW